MRNYELCQQPSPFSRPPPLSLVSFHQHLPTPLFPLRSWRPINSSNRPFLIWHQRQDKGPGLLFDFWKYSSAVLTTPQNCTHLKRNSLCTSNGKSITARLPAWAFSTPRYTLPYDLKISKVVNVTKIWFCLCYKKLSFTLHTIPSIPWYLLGLKSKSDYCQLLFTFSLWKVKKKN